MLKQKLGRKQVVEVRQVFEKESRDFTPWLNENLDLLSEKLNLEIIDSSIEEDVGEFSCDIVAKDSDSNRTIVIENQFGVTNHDHLGKIFTYAAGRSADIIIWIAERFREEHRKTLEWLNEKVDPESGPSFFGIEFKLLKVEDSPPAPDFEVVVQPNDWERSIKISGQPKSETSKSYFEFFSQLIDRYSKANPKWRKVKAMAQSWSGFGAGKSGLYFNWAFRSQNRISVELYIDTGDRNENEKIFEELQENEHAIEEQVGELSWEKLEGRRACRIAAYKDVGGSIKSLSVSDYPQIIEWAATTMQSFSRALSNYIRSL
jgi:hypothetical protein